MKNALILTATLAMLTPAMSTSKFGNAEESYEQRLTSPVCEITKIKEISARLGEDVDGKFVYMDPKEVGSAIEYTDGIYGVSYDYVPAISRDSRVGDRIRLCLISQYVNCPKDDERGKTYSAINLRTRGQWTLPDSEHVCGGA